MNAITDYQDMIKADLKIFMFGMSAEIPTKVPTKC